MPFPFNVRVYGILIRDSHLLVTDEVVQGSHYTKLPGGGLEFGEGTIDCLKREFFEEMGIEVEVDRHFYTTDFFVPSAFNKEDQVISIYYLVKWTGTSDLPLLRKKKFDFKPGEVQTFRWIALDELTSEDVDLPIDKVVVDLVLNSML